MDLTEAIRGRRSASRLSTPAPSDEEIVELVEAAATGGDHGLMRPWRLVLVRDEARAALGDAFAADLDPDEEEARSRAAAKALRAPLLVSIVLTPRDNPKVPHWEQLAATAGLAHNLSLLCHARGWGAIWRTGPPSRSRHVHARLGLVPPEQLLGWLYVGTPVPTGVPVPRPPLDARERLTVLRADGSLDLVAGPAAAGRSADPVSLDQVSVSGGSR